LLFALEHKCHSLCLTTSIANLNLQRSYYYRSEALCPIGFYEVAQSFLKHQNRFPCKQAQLEFGKKYKGIKSFGNVGLMSFGNVGLMGFPQLWLTFIPLPSQRRILIIFTLIFVTNRSTRIKSRIQFN